MVAGVTNRHTVFVLKHTLDRGRYYKLALYSSTPNSTTGITEYWFRTNVPPANGRCQANPTSGIIWPDYH